jgi:hypothetical protein
MSDPNSIQGSCDIFKSVGNKYGTSESYQDSASALKDAIQFREFDALPASIINDPANKDQLVKCFSDGFTEARSNKSFVADPKGQTGLVVGTIVGSITGLIIGIMIGKYALK